MCKFESSGLNYNCFLISLRLQHSTVFSCPNIFFLYTSSLLRNIHLCKALRRTCPAFSKNKVLQFFFPFVHTIVLSKVYMCAFQFKTSVKVFIICNDNYKFESNCTCNLKFLVQSDCNALEK